MFCSSSWPASVSVLAPRRNGLVRLLSSFFSVLPLLISTSFPVSEGYVTVHPNNNHVCYLLVLFPFPFATVKPRRQCPHAIEAAPLEDFSRRLKRCLVATARRKIRPAHVEVMYTCRCMWACRCGCVHSVWVWAGASVSAVHGAGAGHGHGPCGMWVVWCRCECECE
jgi:hypothetical protein